jgi:hypothetical protein
VMRWSGLPQGAALFDTPGIPRPPGLPLSLSVAGEARLRRRMDFDACRTAPGCIPLHLLQARAYARGRHPIPPART